MKKLAVDNIVTNYRVAILMATHNGELWLKAQLQSILNQERIDISIYISDDASEDNTLSLLKEIAFQNTNINLLPCDEKFGAAGKNFYRLIKTVDLHNIDYVAFSDQDDLWDVDKLIRHIELAKDQNAEAVSSNVIAFWSDGSKKVIEKSQTQRKLDYLFESAGPGCTFLMTPWLVGQVKEQLNNDYSPARTVMLHDWLTYAICRAHGRKWIIDDQPSLQYRQHDTNVLGANSGIKAKLSRLLKLRQGWYRSEVIKICHVTRLISECNEVKALEMLLISKTLISQLSLLIYVSRARRKLSDRILLSLSILLFLF